MVIVAADLHAGAITKAQMEKVQTDIIKNNKDLKDMQKMDLNTLKGPDAFQLLKSPLVQETLKKLSSGKITKDQMISLVNTMVNIAVPF